MSPLQFEKSKILVRLALSISVTTCFLVNIALSGNPERVASRLLALAEADPRLTLERVEDDQGQTVIGGRYRVYENRALASGRQLELYLLVIPALSESPASDPIFILLGGPGAAATARYRGLRTSWLRERRDIVLIDQRGTGRSNPLHVPGLGSDDDLQTYFEPMFRTKLFRSALDALQKVADLTQYTTINAVDDFDEIRSALGYEKINLRGGSYGSRAALVYMRRHPETIRTATLQGIQPISYLNPLPQARESQLVLERIFEECRTDPRCEEAFPDLSDKFDETLRRLSRQPVEVSVTHPVSSEQETITLDRDDFGEAVRNLLYRLPTNRLVPRLLSEAHQGNYRELAERSLQQIRGARRAIAFGMLMSVVGSEDIPRIDPATVEDSCAGTFSGCIRTKNQLAIAEFWPRGRMPPGFSQPVRVDVPVLLFSGSHDPATSARWGAEAARHLSNSLHVVVPGAHGVFGPEVTAVEKAFLESGTTVGLDLSALRAMKMPPFVIED